MPVIANHKRHPNDLSVFYGLLGPFFLLYSVYYYGRVRSLSLPKLLMRILPGFLITGALYYQFFMGSSLLFFFPLGIVTSFVFLALAEGIVKLPNFSSLKEYLEYPESKRLLFYFLLLSVLSGWFSFVFDPRIYFEAGMNWLQSTVGNTLFGNVFGWLVTIFVLSCAINLCNRSIGVLDKVGFRAQVNQLYYFFPHTHQRWGLVLINVLFPIGVALMVSRLPMLEPYAVYLFLATLPLNIVNYYAKSKPPPLSKGEKLSMSGPNMASRMLVFDKSNEAAHILSIPNHGNQAARRTTNSFFSRVLGGERTDQFEGFTKKMTHALRTGIDHVAIEESKHLADYQGNCKLFLKQLLQNMEDTENIDKTKPSINFVSSSGHRIFRVNLGQQFIVGNRGDGLEGSYVAKICNVRDQVRDIDRYGNYFGQDSSTAEVIERLNIIAADKPFFAVDNQKPQKLNTCAWTSLKACLQPAIILFYVHSIFENVQNQNGTISLRNPELEVPFEILDKTKPDQERRKLLRTALQAVNHEAKPTDEQLTNKLQQINAIEEEAYKYYKAITKATRKEYVLGITAEISNPQDNDAEDTLYNTYILATNKKRKKVISAKNREIVAAYLNNHHGQGVGLFGYRQSKRDFERDLAREVWGELAKEEQEEIQPLLTPGALAACMGQK